MNRLHLIAGLSLCLGALTSCQELPLPPKAIPLEEMSGTMEGQRSPDPKLRFADYLTDSSTYRVLYSRWQTQYTYVPADLNTGTAAYYKKEDVDPLIVPTLASQSVNLRSVANFKLPNALPASVVPAYIGLPIDTQTCQADVDPISNMARFVEAKVVMSNPGILEQGDMKRYLMRLDSPGGKNQVHLYYSVSPAEVRYTLKCRSGVDISAPVVYIEQFNLNLQRGWNMALEQNVTQDGVRKINITTFDAGSRSQVEMVPMEVYPDEIMPTAPGQPGLNENCENIAKCPVP